MAIVVTSLAQAYPAAGQLVDLYLAPQGTTFVVAVWICNHAAATTFRLTHAVNGVSDANEHYLAYDMALEANETYIFEIQVPGFVVGVGDMVRCRSANGACSFNMYGYRNTST
jgi:hypothetical protein